MNTPQDAFNLLRRIRDELTGAGLVLRGEPDCSGELITCGTTKKPYGTDGRYAVHLDEPANVWLINYHEGGEGRTIPLWKQGELDGMTEAEREALRARIRQEKEEAKKKAEERHMKATEASERVFRPLSPAGEENAYLKRKDVIPRGDLRQTSDGRLVVPVRNAEGRLLSLQFLNVEGGKRFLSGGRIKGGFFPVPAKNGSKDGPLLIGEGVATVLSACQATGYAGLTAFDCGNLLPVAEAARKLYPTREIVLLADNDAAREGGNIGVEKATEAARAIGGKLAIPPAHEGRSTDFNDLHVWRSLEAVRLAIEEAREQFSVHLPAGFFIRQSGCNQGLFKQETKGEETFDLRIGAPLRILGKTCDAHSDAWGTLLSWNDPAGIEHRWALPDKLLQKQGREYAQFLAEGGYSIAPGQAAKFAAFIQGITSDRFVTCVPRIGWHKNAYVMPDAAYGVPDNTVVLQGTRYMDTFRTGGNLDAWREIPSLCAGNSRFVFALCAAFAGPLLRLSGVEGGGFSFEGDTSSGKTTALQVAASVWGGPEHVRSWRITDNALESVAVLHNDNVLILDEVGQVSSTVLAEVAYMLANGQAKGRASREGAMRRVLTWQLLYLSSGELGLADKLAESGLRSRGGQEARFVGIPVEQAMLRELHGLPDAGAVSDRLKALCGQHYGHAGRKFLQWLCPLHKEISQEIQEQLPSLVDALCPPEATEQVRRVAKRFCLVAVAGMFAQQAGLLPSDMEIMPHIKSCFQDWLSARGGAGSSEDAAILKDVRLFIEQHGQSRFQDVTKQDVVCVNRVGFRRQDGEDTEYIVLSESFGKEVVKGHSARRAGAVLRAAGWLRVSDSKNTTKRELPGMGRVRAYVIVLPDENDNDDDQKIAHSSQSLRSVPLTPDGVPDYVA